MGILGGEELMEGSCRAAQSLLVFIGQLLGGKKKRCGIGGHEKVGEL